MHWIAPSEEHSASETLEKRLWATADQFRANSGLKARPQSHLLTENSELQTETA